MQQAPPTGAAGSAEVDALVGGAFEPGELLGERYRVERVLARGGMGILVAATDLSLDRPVALKFLTGETLADPKARARFLREARLAGKLRSEHVVTILDIGSVAERGPFIAMELLQGCDLKEHLAEHGPMPVALATEIVLQACEAIAEAHSHGIIHRDLKPRNLFLARHVHGAPLVKVLDFGISKVALAKGHEWTKRPDEVTLTGTGEVVGSPSYMPPEQLVSARDVDATADIFSLGVVLYQLITGVLPFRGATPKDVAIAILGGEPQLGELAARAPEELVQVVARCLDRAPSKRLRTVVELARALEPFAGASARGAAQRVAGAASVPAPPAAARASLPDVAPERAFEASESVATTIRADKSRIRPRWPAVVLLGAVGAIALLALRPNDAVPARAADAAPTPSTTMPSSTGDAEPIRIEDEGAPPTVAPAETGASTPAPTTAVLPEASSASTSSGTSPPRAAPASPRPATTATATARARSQPPRVFIPEEPR